MSAAPSENYFDPQTIARIEGLKLRVQHLVNGIQSGIHRSIRSGWSAEFAQHRDYAPGDDPRHIDWKVYGRTDKLYVKRFEDDSRIDVNLLLDTSSSMYYQGEQSPLSKFEYLCCVACCLAWIAHSQQDRIGLSLFDQSIGFNIEPSDREDQFHQIVFELQKQHDRMREHAHDRQRSTNLKKVFRDAIDVYRSHGLTIVISDLLDQDLSAGFLRELGNQQNDIWLIHLMDADELTLPFGRPFNFLDLEGAVDIDADPLKVRSAYCEVVNEYIKRIRHQCHDLGIRYQQCATEKPIHDLLVELTSQ